MVLRAKRRARGDTWRDWTGRTPPRTHSWIPSFFMRSYNWQLTLGWSILSRGVDRRGAREHYGDALWKGDFAFPEALSNKVVVTCDDVVHNHKKGKSACSLIISAIAPRLGFLENQLRDAGFIVVSISPFERQKNPLCVLEANAEVLKEALLSSAQQMPPLIKSPNCVCCGTSVVLAALADAFGHLDEVSVTTFQSLSGRGDAKYPAEKVVNNVYPLHGTAEATEALIQEELETVLGERASRISVTAYRVSVQRGHLVDVRVKLAGASLASVEQVYAKLESFDPLQNIRTLLPSVPSKPIVCAREGGFPRPATNFSGGNSGGLSVTVGNVKINNGPYDICLSLVVDNLVKGALGAGLQLLEYSTASLDNFAYSLSPQKDDAKPPLTMRSTHCAECRTDDINGERVDDAFPHLRLCDACWKKNDAIAMLLERSSFPSPPQP